MASSLFRCLSAGSWAAHEGQDARHRIPTRHGSRRMPVAALARFTDAWCQIRPSARPQRFAARPTKSPRTDLSSSFEGCLHRWPPHAALLARELAESWSQKLSHRALQRCHNPRRWGGSRSGFVARCGPSHSGADLQRNL